MAAWATGPSDFCILTLGLNLVPRQILRVMLERSGTVNGSVNGVPQRSWAPGRRHDTSWEGSGSLGYRPFRLLHSDLGFEPSGAADFEGHAGAIWHREWKCERRPPEVMGAWQAL